MHLAARRACPDCCAGRWHAVRVRVRARVRVRVRVSVRVRVRVRAKQPAARRFR